MRVHVHVKGWPDLRSMLYVLTVRLERSMLYVPTVRLEKSMLYVLTVLLKIVLLQINIACKV